jgi:hypothetical protein
VNIPSGACRSVASCVAATDTGTISTLVGEVAMSSSRWSSVVMVVTCSASDAAATEANYSEVDEYMFFYVIVGTCYQGVKFF